MKNKPALIMGIVSFILLCALLTVMMVNRPNLEQDETLIKDAERTAFIEGAMFCDNAWAASINDLGNLIYDGGDEQLADMFFQWADDAVWTREELEDIADEYLTWDGTL